MMCAELMVQGNLSADFCASPVTADRRFLEIAAFHVSATM